jgi:hypothetical protein
MRDPDGAALRPPWVRPARAAAASGEVGGSQGGQRLDQFGERQGY